eukprot:scaffold55359_cov18-Tisochrysis_lutea.AAC.4
MPSLIRQISSAAKSSPKQQYLLLTALSEVITTCSEQTNLLLSQVQEVVCSVHKYASQSGCTPHLRDPEVQAPICTNGTRFSACADDQAQVLSLLLGSAEGEEECRTVVAECLGRLSLLSPEKVCLHALDVACNVDMQLKGDRVAGPAVIAVPRTGGPEREGTDYAAAGTCCRRRLHAFFRAKRLRCQAFVSESVQLAILHLFILGACRAAPAHQQPISQHASSGEFHVKCGMK